MLYNKHLNPFWKNLLPKGQIHFKQVTLFSKNNQSKWFSLKEKNSNPVIRVMSYNILAPCYTSLKRYCYCDPSDLSWSKRSSMIEREILDVGADFVCLQEVEGAVSDDFFGNIKENGYEEIYYKRPGNRYDGEAIFWDPSKYQKKWVGYMPFNGSDDDISFLDYDNMVLFALFQPTFGSKLFGGRNEKILLVNTHLAYEEFRNDVRLGQVFILSKAIKLLRDKFSSDGSYCHVIMSGDFNFNPNDVLYSYIQGHQLEVNKILEPKNQADELKKMIKRCQKIKITTDSSFMKVIESNESDNNPLLINETFQQNLNFKCSYDEFTKLYCESIQNNLRGKNDQHDYITHRTMKKDSIVDYIWYLSKNLVPCKILKIQNADTHERASPIPNENYPSDHFSLVVDFKVSDKEC